MEHSLQLGTGRQEDESKQAKQLTVWCVRSYQWSKENMEGQEWEGTISTGWSGKTESDTEIWRREEVSSVIFWKKGVPGEGTVRPVPWARSSFGMSEGQQGARVAAVEWVRRVVGGDKPERRAPGHERLQRRNGKTIFT
jgi:hypothetical protein